MAENEISLGELSRNLNSLENRINNQFQSVVSRLDNLQFVPREVYNVQIKQLDERLEDLEESKKWQIRTLVVSFLFPILVAVVVAGVVIQ